MLKLFLLLLMLLPLKQQTWQLQSDDDGIRLYTATAPGEGKIKPIKLECTFNATPAQLVAVLMDIKSYTQWVYHTKSAAVIKQAGPTDLYYYSEVNVPWPGKNRDFVSHITVTQDPATKVITIDAPNVPGMAPEKENVYRTTNSKGKWIITPDGNDKAKVIYYLQVDAGGDAPAWLVNLFITDGPRDTFKKLRKQLQKAEYKR
jgi:ribosome-associated toxin RatA of RatAB toxin-antitoxin module